MGFTVNKYNEMAKLALNNFGGLDNIEHISHCATRLRIDVVKASAVDIEKLKNLPDSAGAILRQNQIQIIIGPNVSDAYNAFKDEYDSSILKSSIKNINGDEKKRMKILSIMPLGI